MNPADHPSSSTASTRGGRRSTDPLGLVTWMPWLLVATLAVVCLWLGQLYVTIQAEAALLRDQQRLTEIELRSARQQAEAERILAQREIATLREKLGDR